MTTIVNADQNWAIGNKGGMVFPIPDDLKFFRQATQGKTVVMGRKTLESLPNGQPLKNRTNIVLSRSGTGLPEGVLHCRNAAELAKVLDNYTSEELFVIGGEGVYRLLLPFCSTALITRVQAAAAEADTFFPNLDETPGWHLAAQSETHMHEDISYTFCTYQNDAVLPLSQLEDTL